MCQKGIEVDGGLVGGFNHASDIFATVANLIESWKHNTSQSREKRQI